MHFQRPSMLWCVLATVVLAAACDRAASPRGDQRGVPTQALKIDDVKLKVVDSELTFFYRTRTSTGDCKAQAAEMPKVWDLLVKAHLRDSHVQRVILFPQDPSGQSVTFVIEKSASEWSSSGPCPITIPDS
jgi:hypothetical protein